MAEIHLQTTDDVIEAIPFMLSIILCDPIRKNQARNFAMKICHKC